MNFKEYGKENSKTIILLHGGGLSWWNYKVEAELLKNDHHVVLPILDGHADSDRRFTSIEDNAQEIIDFINENHRRTCLPNWWTFFRRPSTIRNTFEEK